MKAPIHALLLVPLLAARSFAQDPAPAPESAPQEAATPDAPAAPTTFGGFLRQIDGLEQPAALAYSPEGELWVAEAWGRALSIYDEKGALRRRLALEIPPNLKLNEPRGLAIADDGTVYVSDAKRVVGFGWDGERLRHTGLRSAVNYALVEPRGLAVDAQRLYIADAGLHLVLIFERKSSKFVGALGGWGGADGQFRRPVDVAVDEEGRLYVADQGNHRVQRFSAAGEFLGAFGGFGPYAGLFAAPSSVEYAAGRVYVADRDNHRVQVFDRAGKLLYDWGVHAVRPHEGQGHLHYPDALAIASDGRTAALAEGFEDRVQVFGAEDEPSRILRAQSERTSSAHYGGGVAARGRLCVVLEPSAPCALALDTSGGEAVELARFGRLGEKPAQFSLPAGVALAPDERAWICDPGLKRLSIFRLDRPADATLKYDPFLPRFAESLDFAAIDGGEPVAVALDGDGRAWVLESRGEVLVFAPGFREAQARTLPAATVVAPCAIAVRADGSRAVVADPAAHALHVFEAQEHGWKTIPWKAEGRQPRPSGVAFAADGSLFVTDEARDEVVHLSPALERVASWGQRGLGRVEFARPHGVAIDERGQVYVLDLGNHRVQVLTASGEFVQAFGSRLFTDPTRKRSEK